MVDAPVQVSSRSRKRKSRDGGDGLERKKKRKSKPREPAVQATALDGTEQTNADITGDMHSMASVDSQAGKERKRNRATKGLKEPSTDASPDEQIMETAIPSLDESPENNDLGTDSKQTRFIVFVGNLPYTTTTASLQSHFFSLKPASIRHITQKDDPSKSKGFAFLEFDNYDRMRTCLKLFHHSQFDDGKGSARRINVELTAGGGGRSKQRRQKLKAKNERLSDQRKRQNETLKQASRSKELSRATDGGPSDLHSEAKDSEDAPASDIHPSRRGMIKE